jgi:cell division protein FtsX
VETVSTLTTCVAASAAGFAVGKYWAPDAIWSAVFGVVAGEVCAAVFWALALSLATLVPSADINARAVGFDFEILVLATPVCGAIAGYLGYRRALPPR